MAPAEADASTPLLARDRDGSLPGPNGMIKDHPIFLRVCHSPWPFISQGCLVYARALIVAYLTALGIMLFHYKSKHEIHVLDDEGEEGEFSKWQIIFQFSSLAYFLLWTYHWQCFCWSFTHLYYPDVGDDDAHWDSLILKAMTPPQQTPYSRKRFYFSLYYTIVHVVVFMNVLIYWSVLVPKGHGHFPKGGDSDEEESISAADGFFDDGWFQPFCLINLWGTTGFIAIIEIMFLNSIKRQIPVPSHIFSIMFFLCCYLGWASFGHNLTGVYPFFWLDPEEMEYTEAICAYSFGFVTMGPTVFSFMYGLIGMRESLTKKDEAPTPKQRFNPVQFVQDIVQGSSSQQQEAA